MALNKAQMKRVNNAVRRGSMAAMQRAKEKQTSSQDATQSHIKAIIWRG